MPTPQHQVVKPQVLANTAVGMLEQELLVPALFQKESIDQFKGAEDDTVSVKVEGVLPYREYEWRNDRSTPIEFDVYKERKIAVSFGGNVYNAIKLTDEQNDFDIDQWSKLLRPQVKAVARGLGRRAVKTLTDQTYAVTVAGATHDLRRALIEARRVLNKFQVPDGSRYLLVGTDFETALLADDRLSLASAVGDSEADSILKTATLGNRYGFNIVVDQTIPSDAAYAFADNGFVFLSGAPSVPQSVPFGATQSFEGVAMRWVRDYDPTYMQDRSVVNTYAGFRSVTDILVGWDEANKTEVISESEHFVRGIKLTLEGTSSYPTQTSELGKITGIHTGNKWQGVAPAAPSA